MDHTKTEAERDKEDRRYKLPEEPDPNGANAEPKSESLEVSDNVLNTDEKKRLFVQVAAMCDLDAVQTHNFSKQFLFGGEVTLPQIRTLIEKYRDEILGASSAISLYVSQNFDYMSLVKQAEVINRGLKSVMLQIEIAERQIKFLHEANTTTEVDIAKADKLANRTRSLASQFTNWFQEKDRWVTTVQEQTKDIVVTEYTAIQGKGDTLDSQKLSGVMKHNGVAPEIADKVAGLIVTGDYYIQNHSSEEEHKSRYFSDDDPEVVDAEYEEKLELEEA